MSYQVRVLARAQADLDDILTYLSERSPEGAARLIASFDQATERLGNNPFVAGIAPESEDLDEEIRHIMFRTRAGRTYRALFVVVGDEVRILRVRGSGQSTVKPDDLEI